MAGHETIFCGRLRHLGFSSYADYLSSTHWAEFRQKYFLSQRPKTCLVCGDGRIQLHHVTYERLGQEKLKDVVPLCRKHHEDVHSWLKQNHAPLYETHRAIAYLGSLLFPPGKGSGNGDEDDRVTARQRKERSPKRKHRTRKQKRAILRESLGINKQEYRYVRQQCHQVQAAILRHKVKGDPLFHALPGMCERLELSQLQERLDQVKIKYNLLNVR